LFREVNERINEIAKKLDLGGPTRATFVCECSHTGCAEQIELTLKEYAWVRADARRFVCVPGHQEPEFETVVAETERYVVVEKEDAAGEVAEALDPRS
jgi:hypothetical protein